jgi:crotonobetainyl-CoA:carnitine CoA-transferase CaiB-like acyl-CoA transferase
VDFVESHEATLRLRGRVALAKLRGFASSMRRPTSLGQHTDEVLRELGSCADEIAALRREAVVA